MAALKLLLISLVVLIVVSGVSTEEKEAKPKKMSIAKGLEKPKKRDEGNSKGKITKFDDGIKGQFIIEYKKGASASQKAKTFKKTKGRKVKKLKNNKKTNLVVADKLSDRDLRKLEKDPDVVRVFQDQQIKATSSCEDYTAFSWGQDRLDQPDTAYDDTMRTSKADSNDSPDVTVYVLSTGIDANHPDFTGRASTPWSYFGGSQPYGDDGAHGTFMAGIVGGHNFGIAKYTNLVGVKILDSYGYGSVSSYIWGIWWAVNNFLDILEDRPEAKGVILIDGYGYYNYYVNDWTKWAVDQNIPVIVAAGNSYYDVWHYSPASTPEAITVAASTKNDKFAWFSNYGDLVDIVAPGVDVKSLVPSGCPPPTEPVNPTPPVDDPCMKTAIWSGTSYAAAHVAGVIGHFLQLFPDPQPSPADIRAGLKSIALDDQIPTYGTTGDLLQVLECSGP